MLSEEELKRIDEALCLENLKEVAKEETFVPDVKLDGTVSEVGVEALVGETDLVDEGKQVFKGLDLKEQISVERVEKVLVLS